MKLLFSLVVALLCVLPAYSKVTCDPLVDYHDGKHLMPWRKMCVGYPYTEDTQHDIGVDGFNGYKIVLGASGGYKRVNACCKGFRTSKIYKALHDQLNRDLAAAAKTPLLTDSAGAVFNAASTDTDTTGSH